MENVKNYEYCPSYLFMIFQMITMGPANEGSLSRAVKKRAIPTSLFLCLVTTCPSAQNLKVTMMMTQTLLAAEAVTVMMVIILVTFHT